MEVFVCLFLFCWFFFFLIDFLMEKKMGEESASFYECFVSLRVSSDNSGMLFVFVMSEFTLSSKGFVFVFLFVWFSWGLTSTETSNGLLGTGGVGEGEG